MYVPLEAVLAFLSVCNQSQNPIKGGTIEMFEQATEPGLAAG